MSKYPLSLLCSYSFRDDVKTEERPPGEAARVGSLTHGLVEAYVASRSVAATVIDNAELEKAKRIFHGPLKDYLDARAWDVCEVGIRYDAENDVAVDGPRRGQPGYDDHGPMIMKGTLDLGRIEGDTGRVEDLKTGSERNAHEEQIIAQGVAFARRHNLRRVFVGFLFAKVRSCPEPKWIELDADRIDYEAGRIRRHLRLLPESKPQPGDHCWRCDLGKAKCPAWELTVPKDLEEAWKDAEAAQ